MSKQNIHKTFTAQDIIRYHSGAMSGAERHALEKAALEDPFLADAIEGYSYASNTSSDIKELELRLQNKTQKAKVIPLAGRLKYISRIAASLFIVLLAGWGIYQLSNTNTKEIGLQRELKKDLPSNTSATTTSDSIRADDSITQSDLAAVVNGAEASKPQVTTTTTTNKKIIKEPKTESVSAISAPLNSSSADIAQMTAKEFVPRDTTSLQTALEGKIAGLTIRGQVTDERGKPVPYATVAQPNTRQATLADANGRFRLTIQDTASPLVSALGFETQKLSLTNPEAEEKVVLREATSALQEVVVTGYGQARQRSATTPMARNRVESGELEPTIGWSNFDKYVEDNLNPPEEGKDKKIKGEVLLSFEVNKDGEPVNIAVEKSLCPKCDEEAIRLLKEGPKWKSKRGKRGKLRLRF